LISIKNLTFYYSDSDKPSLRDINLEIHDGEFVLLTGPSGGGKSSLCRCLNGLIPHFYGGKITGKVEINGLNVTRHSTRELATMVGMVFQDPENQLVTVDVDRELAFGLENLAFAKGVIAKRVEEALDTVGIASLRHRATSELSGGEKQRVAIASVLALYPDIVVLDEPTSELDPKGAEDVLNVVERLNDELGITVILVEHRLDRVVAHSDRVIVLENGMITADGGPRSILSDGRVSQSGVGIPPIIKLAQAVKGKGMSLRAKRSNLADNTPLTVKEGRMALAETLRDSKPFASRHSEHPSLSLQAEGVAIPRPFAIAQGDNKESVIASSSYVIASETKQSYLKPLIEVKNLWHAYPDGFVAIKDIDLRVCPGEFVAIMGRNASGKTTLVKHFNGLLKPTKGDVILDDINTREATVAELSRKVGYVFQNPNDHLFCDTVEEELAFTLNNLGGKGGEAKPLINQTLERFDLTQYRYQYPRVLSGGEKQRVALASILVAQPQVIILDEPTRGMEYRLKAELMRFLDQYRIDGRAVILVTQDVEMVAEFSDRVVLLSEGKIVVDDPKREVLSRALLFSPQINRLAQALKSYGVPDNILTADEMIEALT
jgi:energy-coupling factor transporter ATP-binding protein EcfA2